MFTVVLSLLFSRDISCPMYSLKSFHNSVDIDLKQLISFILSQVFNPFPYLELLFLFCVFIGSQL